MQVVRRALALLGLAPEREPLNQFEPDYQKLMHEALERVRLSELCIQEARSLEELDTGRSQMAAAWAEVQQLVRTAKRERGIALKPISETEEMHRTLREHLNSRSPVRRASSAKAAPRPLDPLS